MDDHQRARCSASRLGEGAAASRNEHPEAVHAGKTDEAIDDARRGVRLPELESEDLGYEINSASATSPQLSAPTMTSVAARTFTILILYTSCRRFVQKRQYTPSLRTVKVPYKRCIVCACRKAGYCESANSVAAPV